MRIMIRKKWQHTIDVLLLALLVGCIQLPISTPTPVANLPSPLSTKTRIPFISETTRPVASKTASPTRFNPDNLILASPTVPLETNFNGLAPGVYLLYEKHASTFPYNLQLAIMSVDGSYDRFLQDVEGKYIYYSPHQGYLFILDMTYNGQFPYIYDSNPFMFNFTTMKSEGLPAIPENCMSLSLSKDKQSWVGACVTDIYLNTDIFWSEENSFVRLTYCKDNQDDCSQPSWSPDGKWISYLRRPGGALAGHPTGLFLMNTSCLSQPKNCESIATGPFKVSSGYTWSPDGKYIASEWSGYIRIYKVVGSGLVLYKDLIYASIHGSLVWSPDGTSIAYANTNDIYMVDIQDGQPRLIAQNEPEVQVIGLIPIQNSLTP